MSRLKEWIGLPELEEPRKVSPLKAVEEACNENNWRGIAVTIYESDNYTIFEDMTGFLSSISATQWLKLAQKDKLEFVGYNDAVPYGQIIIIRNNRILKDFLNDEQDPSKNKNVGHFDFEGNNELETWADAAGYIDGQLEEIDEPDEVILWIFEAPKGWLNN